MARKKGTDKITIWLRKQTPEVQAEFRDYARRHYHRKVDVLTWLIDRGLDISLDPVYRWMNANVEAGAQAQLFNQSNNEYVGVEVVPALEQILVQLTQTARRFYEILEGAPEGSITPNDVLTLLPQYAREMRSTASQITVIRQRIDTESLIMTGATRILGIVMGLPGIRDTSDEEFIRQSIESAILQMREELQSKSVAG
jgi:hypothetical protein